MDTSSGIKKEIDGIKSKHFKRQKGSDERRRNVEARDDLEEVLACYHRIHGYLQRLTVSQIAFVSSKVKPNVA